jgi:hypothetical protein
MDAPNTEEVWALCRLPRDRIWLLRYTLEAYEGLCLATTAPGGGGLVWVRTSPGLRRELEATLEALGQEMGVEVLGWGSGPPRLLDAAQAMDRKEG